MKKKTKQNKIALIPTKIVEEIKSLGLSKIQEQKCFHLVSIIRNKSRKDNDNYFSFSEIPSEYLKKVFTEKYKQTVDYLLAGNIILRDNTFMFGDNTKCISYKVDNRFMDDKLGYSIISYNSVLFDSKPEYVRNRELFIQDIKQLNIDTKKLISITNEKIDKLNISSFRVNEEISEDSIYVCFKKGNYEQRYNTTTEKALETARKHNISLIQDKRKFFLMDEGEFIAMKKDFILASYTDSISKIEKKYWYADRNATNQRLDTNITNMCGELMKEIINSNDLVELDLSNSQFSILSHIIPSEVTGKDVELFKKLSYSGELYDYIKEIIGLESKKEAKQVTFELLFSSYKNRSKKLALLKKVFPNVIEWINNYKKENGSEQFAIMLQKKESEIFIDHIWKELKRQKYFALTKHDCIICKKEDESAISEFIQMYFDSIGFEGKINKG